MNSDSVCSLAGINSINCTKAIPEVKGAGCKRHPTGAERVLRSSDNCGCSARGGSHVGVSVHDVVVFTFPLPSEFWSANLFIKVGSELCCGLIMYRFLYSYLLLPKLSCFNQSLIRHGWWWFVVFVGL